MQSNADRRKEYVALEKEHVAVEEEIQKHLHIAQKIEKKYVAVEEEILKHPHAQHNARCQGQSGPHIDATQNFQRDAPTEADPVNARRRTTKLVLGASTARPDERPTRATTTCANWSRCLV